jgi:chemotaxis receptor (MCP) glutamine deamidase CheD
LCVWLSFGANPTARGNPFQEAATSDANFVAEPGALFTWILDSCIAIPIRITQKKEGGGEKEE